MSVATARTVLKERINLNSGDFSTGEAQALTKVFEAILNELENVDGLEIGDLSGATDGQQLTYDDSSGTWIPGDPNPA